MKLKKLNWVIPLFAAAGLALAGCGGGSSSSSGPTPATGGTGTQTGAAGTQTPEQLAMAASEALKAAEMAVMGLDNDSTDEEVADADAKVMAAATAVAAAAVDAARSEKLGMLRNSLASKKTTRMAAMEAAEEAEKMAMMATVTKLFKGIRPASGQSDTGTVARYATASDTGDAELGDIWLGISGGGGVTTGLPIGLREDKETSVPAIEGWAGKRYARTLKLSDGSGMQGNDGTYEAYVYSNVEEPMQGAKFNAGATDLPVVGDLDGDSGETAVLSTLTGYEARVASPSFDQGAGAKEFELPRNKVRVALSGTYYGVAGTYYCTPAADSTCAARKVATGFELGSTLDTSNAFTAGGWTFKPTDPEARVTETLDEVYASYGWWLYKRADGSEYHTGAFYDHKGAETLVAADFAALRGSASYSGGAAGHYALLNLTGGNHDAGKFTADASLTASFGTEGTANGHSVTGMIDNFTGADGMARDWSVELLKSNAVRVEASATSPLNAGEYLGGFVGGKTVWTVGGQAGAKEGGWFGNFYNNGANATTDAGKAPNAVVGTFGAEYGARGKMVGGFGATREE